METSGVLHLSGYGFYRAEISNLIQFVTGITGFGPAVMQI
jgi:hypothetical protein